MNFSQSPIDWLLDSLEPSARLFHAGQYCGAWKASTHGLAQSSFHLVMHGECWLHLNDAPASRLGSGDAVFLLKDRAHWLSSTGNPQAVGQIASASMQPFSAPQGDAGLVCGFFDFSTGLGHWLVQALPDYLILRADDEGIRQARSIFELIIEETRRPAEPSNALLQRLSDLLLIYVLRERLRHMDSLGGILGLAGSTQFRPLFDQLIREPGLPWSLDSMAAVVGMSRSAFFKHFSEQAGQSPGQVLLSLRMHLASQLLQQDRQVAEVAENVGYQSIAAFTRAFKKYSGRLPGAFRREHKL